MPPAVTVCTLVWDPDLATLRACVASILGQRGVSWEAYLVDATGSTEVAGELRALADVEPRCTVLAAPAEHLAAAANEALAASSGELVVLVDQHASIEPSALRSFRAAVEADPTIDCTYADEDVIGAGDGEWRPFYKPGWSPERTRAQRCTGPVTAVRRALAVDIGGFRPGLAGGDAEDLVLRVTEHARRVHHIPEILSHRFLPRPASEADTARRAEARRRVVADHVARCGIDATVELIEGTESFRVRRTPAEPRPPVSIVIPTRGTVRSVWGEEVALVVRSVASVLQTSEQASLEIVVVADPDTPPSILAEVERLGATVLPASGPFSFSQRCNLGVRASRHDLVLLLNDDVLVEQPDWLDVLTGFFSEPDVGVVGARLLYADGRLQHAGVLLNEQPLHVFHGFPGEEAGPFDLLRVDREVSAVTGACLMTRRSLFDRLDGLSEDFAVAFNDVDFCLRARQLAQRVIWTPHCTLYHFESQSRAARPSQVEVDLLYERWGHELSHDPYGNPNLAPKQAYWLPRLGQRLTGPRAAARADRERASASSPLATLATRRSRS